jgi:Domain of unknown function (DUF4124)
MRKAFAIAVIALLGSTAFAAGEVYRWKDATDVWHFSDQPQPGAELVRGTSRPSKNQPGPAQTPITLPATINPPQPVSDAVAQQVRQEAATAKAQNCEKAKVAYDQSVQALRLYKTDDKGNRTYLTSAEIDAARLQARSARDLACGP